MHFWPYPIFEAVRYGEIQRDTQQIQLLDTAEYTAALQLCVWVWTLRLDTSSDSDNSGADTAETAVGYTIYIYSGIHTTYLRGGYTVHTQ